MKKRPLSLAFIWHMHQPWYKEPTMGEYLLPWVRLHGIKDYYEMANILRNFPQIHPTFNFAPSLLTQINDYIYGQAKDTHLKLSRILAKDLTQKDKEVILSTFFLGYLETMINPYPRYKELFDKYHRNETFNEQDLLDLQVWSNLSWFCHSFKEQDELIHSLISKGRNFTEEEKRRLLNKAKWILLKIIPEYKRLQDEGQIEISISPYYHPILPLLIDSSCAKEAEPGLKLPRNLLGAEDDAREQIRQAVRFYKGCFDCVPRGMWPSEGAVSSGIIPLIAQEGITWLASCEGILFRSLERKFDKRDLYRPYQLQMEGWNLSIVFRNRTLSDLISFSYSKWNAADAVKDLVGRLHHIHSQLGDDEDHLVTIILDGENPWEYYQNNGYDFLFLLYEALSYEEGIRTVTVSEYLEDNSPKEVIKKLHPGSWINQNFHVWIGHPEDNLAWECLYEARQCLLKFSEEKGKDASFKEAIENAWNQLFIAEGSDWFWWYGDEYRSEEDEIFDRLFREHLISVYKFIGISPPESLLQPIKKAKRGGTHYPTMARG